MFLPSSTTSRLTQYNLLCPSRRVARPTMAGSAHSCTRATTNDSMFCSVDQRVWHMTPSFFLAMMSRVTCAPGITGHPSFKRRESTAKALERRGEAIFSAPRHGLRRGAKPQGALNVLEEFRLVRLTRHMFFLAKPKCLLKTFWGVLGLKTSRMLRIELASSAGCNHGCSTSCRFVAGSLFFVQRSGRAT